MKFFFTLLLVSSATTLLKAQSFQTSTPQRRVQFRTIGRDSINLNLDEDYNMIEDSCSTIIRQGHVHIRERTFFGKFKDISKLDPSVTVSEGAFTDDGLKDGPFVSRYFNGKLRSKGAYKNGKFDGHWETYYDSGKPALVFEAINDTISIIDQWEASGKKLIDNGKGSYTVIFGSISFKGKLNNGKPDGTWNAYKTDDATQTSIVEEVFKKGKFVKGESSIQKYTDKSRLSLVNPDAFTYSRAEKFMISAVPCNGIKRKHIVNAQYENGINSFSMYISDIVKPVIGRYNIKDFQNVLNLEGDISEKGYIVNLKAHDTFNESLARGVINALRDLPHLQPATADGKPVKQQFTITFTFTNGMYSFSYRFLPVKMD